MRRQSEYDSLMGKTEQGPASAESAVRVSVDIGGTFTDLHLHNPADGVVHAWKTPSTPADPSAGLIEGLTQITQRNGLSTADIGMILHGSTIATNAVLERKLPRGALITTAGFRDVLEIGRHIRRDVYTLQAEPRSLLIPRQLRFEVSERIRADGGVEQALDEAQLRGIIETLRSQQVEAVAIVFLHGYRNPVHEQRAAQLIAELAPEMAVATSFESSPEIREFERTSTTVLNALLRPVISGYLQRVSGRLESAGISAPLYLVQSNGGVASPAEAARLPARLLLSGPAGGAMAMAALARRHCIDNLVGFDMGGTSSDISVVRDGEIGETPESSIDGLPVRLPMIEIRTIGAGGGSIARVENDALRVGPQSAGAVPGPVCYGRGGEMPAVTDANAALGRLDPAAFATGGIKLDVSASSSAVRTAVSEPLGLAEDVAAEGILNVACSHMAGAIRLSLFEKGADPTAFSLAPFGGAAGLHACAVAEELGIERIVFPAHASTLSALGILHADLRHDLSISELLLLSTDNLSAISQSVQSLRQQGRELLIQDRIAVDSQRIEISCDLRYRGQAFEIATPWSALADGQLPDQQSLDALIVAFHQIHESQFAHSAPDDAIEVVTIRAAAIGLISEQHAIAKTTDQAVDKKPGRRRVFLQGSWIEIDVYQRDSLPASIEGPVLIEEDYTVLLITEGWQLSALGDGDLLCRRNTQ
jgi:N-methylhydantoinase A